MARTRTRARPSSTIVARWARFGGPAQPGFRSLRLRCGRSAPSTGSMGPLPTARGQAAAARPALPRVRLIATGGTIANRDGSRLTAEDLVKSIPGVERYARPEFEQFANLPSAALSLDQWLEVARRINTLFRDDTEISGVVVTSGTDTLEEFAYFLHLTIRSDKPVVVVGSMRAPDALGYEGAANLLDGYRVAADPASRGKGVLVVLNEEINSAREVTKTDAWRLETFQTRGYGVLGRRRPRPRRLLPDGRPPSHEGDRVRRHLRSGAAPGGHRPGISGCNRQRDQVDGRPRCQRGSSSRRRAAER